MTIPALGPPSTARLLPFGLVAALLALIVLVVVPWPASFVLLACAVLTGIGCVWPGPLLGLLALSVPVQAAGTLSAGPISVTMTKLVVAALVASFGIRFAVGAAQVHLTLPVWGYAAVVATLLISIMQARDFASWVGEVYRWAVAAVVLVIAQDVVRHRAGVCWTVAGIGVGILGASGLGFYQVIAGVGPPSFHAGGVIRAYATFGEPNPFAAYLELSVPVFLSLTLTGFRVQQRRHRQHLAGASLLLVTLIGTLALLLTQSRGGVLGFAAAVIVVVWWGGPRLRQLSLLIGLVAVLAIGLSPAGHRLETRFAAGGFGLERDVQVTPATWANQERLAHWRAGIAMMEAYPWTGVGAGQFNARYREFTQVWRFRIPRGHAHNGYIQMGAQAGLPGLAAMLLFCGTLLAAAWRGLAAHGAVTRALALGALAVVVAFCVHSVFDYLNVLSLGIQLSLVVSLASRPVATSVRSPRPAWRSERPHTGLTA